MIFDHHLHVFPSLGDETYGSLEQRMLGLKRSLAYDPQGVRRVSDHSKVADPEPTLYRERGSGVSALREDVRIVPRSFGRLAWEFEAQDYYVQWLAPDLQQLEVSAELMLAHMDYLGVNRGLISCGQAYGRLNGYLAEVVRRYPDRFVSCCEVEEWRAFEDSEVEELTRSVEQLGHVALFFDDRQSFRVDYRERYDSPRFARFWNEVRRLGLVVVWDLRHRDGKSQADFDGELVAFRRFVEGRQDIAFVIAHGFNMGRFRNQELPRIVLELLGLPNVHLEILFPLMNGHSWDYPYTQAMNVMRVLYNEVGPRKLIWGSDMPAVQRVCTYRQALEYLTRYATFIPQDDMASITGGNAMRLYRLEPAYG
jgi:predicted TIM-barrel fold metal-dependent hydrolase